MEEQAGSKTALITGAGTGIGAATAVELAKRGMNVVLVGRRIAPLEDVASQHYPINAKSRVYRGFLHLWDQVLVKPNDKNLIPLPKLQEVDLIPDVRKEIASRQVYAHSFLVTPIRWICNLPPEARFRVFVLSKRKIEIKAVLDGRIRAHCFKSKGPRVFTVENILAFELVNRHETG